MKRSQKIILIAVAFIVIAFPIANHKLYAQEGKQYPLNFDWCLGLVEDIGILSIEDKKGCISTMLDNVKGYTGGIYLNYEERKINCNQLEDSQMKEWCVNEVDRLEAAEIQRQEKEQRKERANLIARILLLLFLVFFVFFALSILIGRIRRKILSILKLRHIFAIIGALLPLTMLASDTQFNEILWLYTLLNPLASLPNIIFATQGCYNVLKECPIDLIWNIILSGLIYFALGYLLEQFFTKKPSDLELKSTDDTVMAKTDTKSWSWFTILALIFLILASVFGAYFILYVWAPAIRGV